MKRIFPHVVLSHFIVVSPLGPIGLFLDADCPSIHVIIIKLSFHTKLQFGPDSVIITLFDFVLRSKFSEKMSGGRRSVNPTIILPGNFGVLANSPTSATNVAPTPSGAPTPTTTLLGSGGGGVE